MVFKKLSYIYNKLDLEEILISPAVSQILCYSQTYKEANRYPVTFLQDVSDNRPVADFATKYNKYKENHRANVFWS